MFGLRVSALTIVLVSVPVDHNVSAEVPPPGLRVTDDKIVRVIDLVNGQGQGAEAPIYGTSARLGGATLSRGEDSCVRRAQARCDIRTKAGDESEAGQMMHRTPDQITTAEGP